MNLRKKRPIHDPKNLAKNFFKMCASTARGTESFLETEQHKRAELVFDLKSWFHHNSAIVLECLAPRNRVSIVVC